MLKTHTPEQVMVLAQTDGGHSVEAALAKAAGLAASLLLSDDLTRDQEHALLANLLSVIPEDVASAGIISIAQAMGFNPNGV